MLVYQRVSSQNIFGCGIPLWSYTDISNVMDRFGQRLTASPPKMANIWGRPGQPSFCWPISPKYHWEPMFLHIKPWMTEHIQHQSGMVHPKKKTWIGNGWDSLPSPKVSIWCSKEVPIFLMGRALKIPLETAPLTGLRVSGYPIFGWNDTKFRVGVSLHETNPTKDWTVATWTPKNIKKH